MSDKIKIWNNNSGVNTPNWIAAPNPFTFWGGTTVLMDDPVIRMDDMFATMEGFSTSINTGWK